MENIDLNADLGEGDIYDKQLLKIISSVNIACGFHAGNSSLMYATVKEAHKQGVAIGAHPAVFNLENFGRDEIDTLKVDQVYTQVLYQIGALSSFTKEAGTSLVHVKPHGTLYNIAAKKQEVADAVAKAIYKFDKKLLLLGLAGSKLISAGKHYGLSIQEEVFADRRYQGDGTLVPRSQLNAVLEKKEDIIKQVVGILKYGIVKSIDGKYLRLRAQTICLHGDTKNVLECAKELKNILEKSNIRITKPIKSI